MGDDKDDLRDWLDEIDDVEPLKKQKPRHLESYQVDDFDLTPARKAPAPKMDAPLRPAPPSPPVKAITVYAHENACFSAAHGGVDARAMKRLKKGEFPIGRKIDLHGYTLDDAWAACLDFLHESWEMGHKAVLVVHGKGKGYGEGGQMGLIKSHIAAWLNTHPAVLAYHSALPKHGGSGAVYVLLRKQRI